MLDERSVNPFLEHKVMYRPAEPILAIACNISVGLQKRRPLILDSILDGFMAFKCFPARTRTI